jgi:hypothetical protein
MLNEAASRQRELKPWVIAEKICTRMICVPPTSAVVAALPDDVLDCAFDCAGPEVAVAGRSRRALEVRGRVSPQPQHRLLDDLGRGWTRYEEAQR